MVLRNNIILALGCLLAVCIGHPAILADASWLDSPYSLEPDGHITSPGQTLDGSLTMTLAHDQPCQISVSVAQAGDEVLSIDGDALTTSYKLTGPSVTNPDGHWVGSQTFVTRTYGVDGYGPTSDITISVRAAAASDRANKAGEYSASIVLTVTW